MLVLRRLKLHQQATGFRRVLYVKETRIQSSFNSLFNPTLPGAFAYIYDTRLAPCIIALNQRSLS
jgi:hypothetical protein